MTAKGKLKFRDITDRAEGEPMEWITPEGVWTRRDLSKLKSKDPGAYKKALGIIRRYFGADAIKG